MIVPRKVGIYQALRKITPSRISLDPLKTPLGRDRAYMYYAFSCRSISKAPGFSDTMMGQGPGELTWTLKNTELDGSDGFSLKQRGDLCLGSQPLILQGCKLPMTCF